MHSSPSHLTTQQITKLKTLLGCAQLEVIAQYGGGNSVVYCVQTNTAHFAVKSYPPYAPDQRDRLQAEKSVYQFLNQHNVAAVPGLRACCQQERWLIVDWIEGEIPNQYGTADIQQAIQFIDAITALNTTEAAQALPLAAEACLSLQALIQQINKRLERLLSVSSEEVSLQDFLTKQFVPTFSHYQEKAHAYYRQRGWQHTQDLTLSARSLIPADFGFHNSIRTANGTLFFFDFDYFGWDDPVKLLADILWHPKMNLTAVQQKQFINGLIAVYAQDEDFQQRFNINLPLFGLRWVLILLNEFIPAYWLNRQHAKVHANQEIAKTSQLQRAQQLINTLIQTESIYEFTYTTSL